MDLDEWELIPDDGFLEIHDDGDQRNFSRTYVKDSLKNVYRNYTETPSSKSEKLVESTSIPRLSKQLVPLSVDFQPHIQKTPDQELVKEIKTQATNENRDKPKLITGNIESLSTLATDQDSVFQVYCKKLEGNDSVNDMKMNSPKSSSKGIVIDASKFHFEEKTDHSQINETMIEKEKEDDADGVNMWKWSLTGIGAICSFGFAAAATICVIILGNGQQQRKYHHKLQFQIGADAKVREIPYNIFSFLVYSFIINC